MTSPDSITCPTCASECSFLSRTCKSCGAQLQAEINPRTLAKAVAARRKAKFARKTVLSVRLALGFVAFITLVFTLQKHMVLGSVFGRSPTSSAMESFVGQYQMMLGINYLLVPIYIALTVWAGWNPYRACLIGLILYVATTLINAGIDPTAFHGVVQGIILKIVIIVALLNGLKAAVTSRRHMTNAPAVSEANQG
jgi:hypothetical protein